MRVGAGEKISSPYLTEKKINAKLGLPKTKGHKMSEVKMNSTLQERDAITENILKALMQKHDTGYKNACEIFVAMATVVLDHKDLEILLKVAHSD